MPYRPPKQSKKPLIKQTRSQIAVTAIYRSGAGVHADQDGRYGKRQRHGKHKEPRGCQSE